MQFHSYSEGTLNIFETPSLERQYSFIPIQRVHSTFWRHFLQIIISITLGQIWTQNQRKTVGQIENELMLLCQDFVIRPSTSVLQCSFNAKVNYIVCPLLIKLIHPDLLMFCGKRSKLYLKNNSVLQNTTNTRCTFEIYSNRCSMRKNQLQR